MEADDPERYRVEAKRVREIAKKVGDPEIRRTLAGIAETYDELALKAASKQTRTGS